MLYRAAWVLPISGRPIRDGAVLTNGGRIVAVLGREERAQSLGPDSHDSVETLDLGAAAILPGLVNAHTHLELSWMRKRIPPSSSMPAWASKLIALRREQGTDPPAPIADAIRESRAAGT